MKTIKVYPSPKLSPLEYVPGVGEDGAEIPEKEAEAMLEAGLVVKTKPKSPDATAKSEDKS